MDKKKKYLVLSVLAVVVIAGSVFGSLQYSSLQGRVIKFQGQTYDTTQMTRAEKIKLKKELKKAKKEKDQKDFSDEEFFPVVEIRSNTGISSYHSDYYNVAEGYDELKHAIGNANFFELRAYFGKKYADGAFYLPIELDNDRIDFVYDYLIEGGDEVSIDDFRCSFITTRVDRPVLSCYTDNATSFMEIDLKFQTDYEESAEPDYKSKVYLENDPAYERGTEIAVPFAHLDESNGISMDVPNIYPLYDESHSIRAKCVSSSGVNFIDEVPIDFIDGFTDAVHAFYRFDFEDASYSDAPYECSVSVIDSRGDDYMNNNFTLSR